MSAVTWRSPTVERDAVEGEREPLADGEVADDVLADDTQRSREWRKPCPCPVPLSQVCAVLGPESQAGDDVGAEYDREQHERAAQAGGASRRTERWRT